MPPSPIPAPLPPWAKALLQVTPFISAALQYAIDHLGEIHDASSATPTSWMQVHLVGKPVGSVDSADRFITTFDIANITNGDVDSSWTAADITLVDNALAS